MEGKTRLLSIIKSLKILPIVLFWGIIAGIFFVHSGANAKEDARMRKQAAEKSRYYYYEGQRQELSDNLDAAFECYKRAVELNSENAEANFALGNIRMMVRNEEMQSEQSAIESMGMMRKFVDRYPADFDEGLMYGYMAGYVDTTGESIRVLERLREQYPNRSTLLIYLSQAYQTRGDVAKAVEMMSLYEKNEGMSAPVSMHKISLLLEGKDTVGALQEADKLLAVNPEDYSYLILKGNLYDVINMADSAEQMYLEAERKAPEASGPKLALMESYRNRGDSTGYDNKVYEVLLTEDMQPEEKVGLLAQYLQKLIDDKSDTRRGDTLFNVLESQYPHESELLTLSGRYKWAKHDTIGAIDAMSYALDLNPESQENWQTLVYYQANAGRVADALQTLDREEERTGLTEGMKLYKGVLLSDQKRYEEALTLYRKMINDIDSGLNTGKRQTLRDLRRDISVDELNTLSMLYQMMGDCTHAMGDTTLSFDYFETALEFNPDNTVAANNYAYFIALSGGDLDKAQQLSESSLRNDESNNPTNLDTLAWIYYLKGNYMKAYELQTKVMELMKEQQRVDPEAEQHYELIKEKIKESIDQ